MVRVLEVHDGDTFNTRLDMLPPPLNRVSVRLLGVDTPEYGWRAKCGRERGLAVDAKMKLTELLSNTPEVQLTRVSWDKYGGRILADVLLPDGRSVSQALIAAGVARPYFGEKKAPWCTEE